MATYKEIIEATPEELYTCDGCDKNFPIKDLKLVDASDNFKMYAPPHPFVYVDKKDCIITGSETPTKTEGDRIMACPLCGYTHLFGLTKTPPKIKMVPTPDGYGYEKL